MNTLYEIVKPGHLEKLIESKEFQSSLANFKTFFRFEDVTGLLDLSNIIKIRNIFHLSLALSVVGLAVSISVIRHTWKKNNENSNENKIEDKLIPIMIGLGIGIAALSGAYLATRSFLCLKGVHKVVHLVTSSNWTPGCTDCGRS